jgi:hypothetical protein
VGHFERRELSIVDGVLLIFTAACEVVREDRCGRGLPLEVASEGRWCIRAAVVEGSMVLPFLSILEARVLVSPFINFTPAFPSVVILCHFDNSRHPKLATA